MSHKRSIYYVATTPSHAALTPKRKNKCHKHQFVKIFPKNIIITEAHRIRNAFHSIQIFIVHAIGWYMSSKPRPYTQDIQLPYKFHIWILEYVTSPLPFRLYLIPPCVWFHSRYHNSIFFNIMVYMANKSTDDYDWNKFYSKTACGNNSSSKCETHTQAQIVTSKILYMRNICQLYVTRLQADKSECQTIIWNVTIGTLMLHDTEDINATWYRRKSVRMRLIKTFSGPWMVCYINLLC